MKTLKIIIPSVLSIVLFAVLALTLIKTDISYNIGEVGTSKTPLSQKVTSNVELYDEITVTADGHIENLSILFGTFARKNTNTNKVTVYLNSNKVAEKTFSSANVVDNAYYKIGNLNLDVKSGDKLKVDYTSPNGTEENSIVPYLITGTDNSKYYIKDLSTGKTVEKEGRIAVNFTKTETFFDYAAVKYFPRSETPEWILATVVSLLIASVLVLMVIPDKKISD